MWSLKYVCENYIELGLLFKKRYGKINIYFDLDLDASREGLNLQQNDDNT